MKCCNEIIKIGCFGSCDPINTGIKADVAGTWILEIDFMNMTKKIEVEINEAEEEFIISNDDLNEDYEYIMRIYKPDGSLLNNSCYSFTINKTVCF